MKKIFFTIPFIISVGFSANSGTKLPVQKNAKPQIISIYQNLKIGNELASAN